MRIPGSDVVSAWWEALEVRERRILVMGSLALAGLLGTFLFWLPLEERLALAEERLAERADTLGWMRRSADQVRRLRAAGAGVRTMKSTGESLLSLGDRTARENGLGEALQRVEPEGADRVRFQFEKVSFDALLGWLAKLENRFGVRVVQLSIEKETTPGQVRARLVLAGHSG